MSGHKHPSDSRSLDLSLPRISSYQLIAEFLAKRRILEVGCGTGDGAAFLAQWAAQVISVDTSASLIAGADAKFRRKNLSYRVCEPTNLGNYKQGFDIVVVPDFEWWAAKQTVLGEVKRLLAPTGWAMLMAQSQTQHQGPGVAADTLSSWANERFARVKLFAQLPFQGVSVIALGESGEASPELDCSMVDGEDPPTHYLAFVAENKLPPLRYTVMQIPRMASDENASGSVAELDARLADVKQRADESTEEVAKLRATLDAVTWRQDELNGWKRSSEQQRQEIAKLKAQLSNLSSG